MPLISVGMLGSEVRRQADYVLIGDTDVGCDQLAGDDIMGSKDVIRCHLHSDHKNTAGRAYMR